MNKLTQVSQYRSRSIGTYIGMFAVLGFFISIGLSSQAHAYTLLTSQLDYGEKNSDVTSLQVFFADNSAIYPEGLVTGYFGPLTRSGVQRFQATYDIVSSGTAASTGFGRVGPTTLAKINSLMSSGGWVNADISGPAFYNVVQSKNSNSSTFIFNTNENTMARVVYSTSPMMFNEGDINSNGFGAIGGSAVNSTSGMSTSHSITLSGLQSNTNYYYTITATDSLGNVSAWGPNNTFRTQ